MRIKISSRNSKIGNIPNLSLTPGESCVPGVPCYTEGCYALNAYNRWPNVQNAWDANLEFYEEDPTRFFSEFGQSISAIEPERFRLFVGGDFPDEYFYNIFSKMIVSNHEKTSFLVFTKRYEYDYDNLPVNLKVILSTWPGLPLPTRTDIPWAWLEEDPRRPDQDYFVCVGNCTNCGHICWDKVSPDCPVVFRKHR